MVSAPAVSRALVHLFVFFLPVPFYQVSLCNYSNLEAILVFLVVVDGRHPYSYVWDLCEAIRDLRLAASVTTGGAGASAVTAA